MSLSELFLIFLKFGECRRRHPFKWRVSVFMWLQLNILEKETQTLVNTTHTHARRGCLKGACLIGLMLIGATLGRFVWMTVRWQRREANQNKKQCVKSCDNQNWGEKLYIALILHLFSPSFCCRAERNQEKQNSVIKLTAVVTESFSICRRTEDRRENIWTALTDGTSRLLTDWRASEASILLLPV